MQELSDVIRITNGSILSKIPTTKGTRVPIRIPDPDLHFNADPDRAFYFNADPDPYPAPQQ